MRRIALTQSINDPHKATRGQGEASKTTATTPTTKLEVDQPPTLILKSNITAV